MRKERQKEWYEELAEKVESGASDVYAKGHKLNPSQLRSTIIVINDKSISFGMMSVLEITKDEMEKARGNPNVALLNRLTRQLTEIQLSTENTFLLEPAARKLFNLTLAKEALGEYFDPRIFKNL